ncbi:MAG: hypothetical protein IPJ65_41125 [Archangiaceae bacterium]|nr:hypothetical protein [Archangiaceae bacterium]
MRDPNNKKIDLGQGFLDEPDYSKLTPMTLRVRIYAVSVGSTWVPPVAPDAGTVTPDAGHDAGSFVDAGRPDAGRPDAGPVDAGAIDSGSPGGPEDAGPPDAGEVENTGSTTGEPLDAGSMMTHVDPPDPMEPGGVTLGGCSSSMAGAAIAFSLLLPALRRRRRTR